MNSKGSVLLMGLPMILALVAVSVLVFNWGHAQAEAQRLQIIGDEILASSLRLRVDGLQKIADRWEAWGSLFIGADSQGALIQSSSWHELETQSQKLKRALSGYKGRIKSVIKVVAEANGLSRDQIQIPQEAGSQLGLSPQGILVTDESGGSRWVEAAWYNRDWNPNQRLAQPSETTQHHIQTQLPLVGGGAWSLSHTTVGRIQWDVSLKDNSIQNHGNGGFPRFWEDAIEGGQVRPHRFPHFRAALVEGP